MNRNQVNLIIVIGILCLCILLSSCKKEDKYDDGVISRTEFMMDTMITIKIYDEADESILDEVFDRLKEIENRMSKTIENSDVSKINKQAGIEPVQVHKDVYFVLERALYFAELSQGAYEPTIGPLVELWGINVQDNNKEQSIPDQPSIRKAINKVDYKKLELLEDNKVFLQEEGMKIDLGGIVKGYAADETKRILNENGVKNAIIDFGGNIYACGRNPSGEPWKIGIQNPFELNGKHMGIINAVDCSIVVSGDYERFFEFEGKRYHHIIDSKTGYPSENELSAVCVIANDSIDADALTTALFVLGIEEGSELLNKMDDVDSLFITKEKQVYVPPNLKDIFEIDDKEFIIIDNKQ